MIPLTREAILSASDLPREEVHVKPWNGVVYVRALAGAERDAFEAATFQSKGQDVETNHANLRARLAVLTVCDHAGQRLFTDDDAEALGQKSAAALDQIFEVAMRLNRFRKEDVEDMVKNSRAVPSAASGSS